MRKPHLSPGFLAIVSAPADKCNKDIYFYIDNCTRFYYYDKKCRLVKNFILSPGAYQSLIVKEVYRHSILRAVSPGKFGNL